MYQNKYHHTMEIMNPKYKSVMKDVQVQRLVLTVVEDLNNYYQNATRQQVFCKKYLTVNFNCEKLEITLETEKPLPNSNRRGQCMRQLSRFMLHAGFDQYLYGKKLLRSV